MNNTITTTPGTLTTSKYTISGTTYSTVGTSNAMYWSGNPTHTYNTNTNGTGIRTILDHLLHTLNEYNVEYSETVKHVINGLRDYERMYMANLKYKAYGMGRASTQNKKKMYTMWDGTVPIKRVYNLRRVIRRSKDMIYARNVLRDTNSAG